MHRKASKLKIEMCWVMCGYELDEGASTGRCFDFNPRLNLLKVRQGSIT